MFKIGIIGTENLHARQFAGIFSGKGEYADFKVTHAGGMYPEANEKLKNELFKLELELNQLKSYTPTTTDLIFSFGDDNVDIEKNTKEQETIAKKIRAINNELRNYINQTSEMKSFFMP